MTKPYGIGVREKAAALADYCKLFGNTQRVLILWSLNCGELSVSDIAAQVSGSLQNTSQHLQLMKSKGILAARRDGQTIYYHIVENETMKRCPLIDLAPDYETS